MRVRAFLISMRPWSFPVTVSPILIGCAVAYRNSGGEGALPVSLSSFLLTLIGGLSVHSFGNLVNTYCDALYGVDRKDNAADDRAIVDGLVSSGEVRALAIACLVIAFSVLVTLADRVIGVTGALNSFLLLVLAGVSLAYAYTGWPFLLKYRRLGDIVIFICFGPLLVEGAHLVQTGTLSLVALELSVPVGLLTEAILHANNARDIEIDLQAGAHTLANSIGFAASYRLFQVLYFAAFAMLPLFAYKYGSFLFFLPLLVAPQLPALFAAFRAHAPKKKDDAATTGGEHICDMCGQFSFGFGALLAVVVAFA